MTSGAKGMDGSAGARVVVIPIDIPVPANSGGRIDVWRRAGVLRAMGGRLGLLTWYDLARNGEPTLHQRSELSKLFEAQMLQAISRSPINLVRRLMKMLRWPSHAAARWAACDRQAVINWARNFNPDVVLLDGLYGAPLALWLAETLKVPLVYRSHNIEAVYMRRQLASASGLKRKLGLWVNLIGLASLERKVMGASRAVLDISLEDMAHWRQQGYQHVHWLPPVVDADFVRHLAGGSQDRAEWDLLYFGNLNTPNNVKAVSWLLREVLPRLKTTRFRLCLAGSRPSAELVQWAAEDPRVHLLADPPNMAEVIRSARVLVNPVFAVSGVNLKSVEMLFSDAALVSTSAGVQGLPDAAKACFELCDDASVFAAAVDAALLSRPSDVSSRLGARRLFESSAAEGVLRQHLLGNIPGAMA